MAQSPHLVEEFADRGADQRHDPGLPEWLDGVGVEGMLRKRGLELGGGGSGLGGVDFGGLGGWQLFARGRTRCKKRDPYHGNAHV